MNANETAADRVRALLTRDHRIVEKRMFGGLGFMLNGNMALGVSKKGELMVRLGSDGETAVRDLAGAEGIDFAHRMGGMLFVPDQAIGDDEDLRRWVDLALCYAATLPVK